MHTPVLVPCASEDRARHPRTEFFVADALLLTQRFLAAGCGNDLFEDLSSDLFNTRAFQNLTGVDVHVFSHAIVDR